MTIKIFYSHLKSKINKQTNKIINNKYYKNYNNNYYINNNIYIN